ncbi:MAG: sensor histidine kinase [Planctomycetota bacterium]|jgi:signal transduction histidine kinase
MKKQIHIKRGIHWKLLSTMMGLIVGLLIIITIVQTLSQNRILEHELENRITLMRENLLVRGKTLSDHLARLTESSITSFNLSNVSKVLKKSVSEDKNLNYAVLTDYDAKVYVHTLKPELEQETLTNDEDWFAVNQTNAVINEYKKNNDYFMEFIVPIDLNMAPWGVLRLGFSLDELHKEIKHSRADILNQIKNTIVRSILTSVIFIFIGIAIVFMISTKFSKPLINLTGLARKLSKGDFSATENIKITSTDEIGVLGSAFVEMSTNIKESHKKLEEYSRSLEQKVEDRTLRLKKALVALQEQDKVKTEFLSTVSHELRTPLALVLGFAKIIGKKLDNSIFPNIKVDDKKTQKVTKQVKDNINIIVSEGKRLTDLIDDLLDISKIEAGEVEWKMEKISVTDIVEQALNVASNLLVEKNLKLIKDVEGGLPKIVCDKDRLIQVIINLVSNAVKFTKEGSITCMVRRADSKAMISIIDTGRGIKKGDQEKIFEKFKQVGDTLTDKPKGTGLGLLICKQIVEFHDGRIWVESKLGKGSSFSFTIPFNFEDNDQVEE